MIKKCVLFFSFFCSGLLLFGEIIYVEDILVSVNGNTNERSLLRVMEFFVGLEFETEKDLENKIKLGKDKLDDTRLFKSVGVRYEYRSLQGERRPVVVYIDIVETWNIIALPYPKYDSNDGFELSLRARDYNFLGLMEPLRINLNYVIDEGGNHEFELEFNYTFNFLILEQNFYLDLTQDFNYHPEDSYGDDFYMGSTAKFGTSFLMPWDVYVGNQPTYSLSLSASREYAFDGISDERDEIGLTFSHGLGLGQASWDGNNYRDGMTYSLSNSWDYDIEEDVAPADAWSSDLTAKVQFHKDLYPLGYSGRLGLYQNLFTGDTSNIEAPFRGILEAQDYEAKGYLYLNNALYLSVWNNKGFWEIMGGPTLDVGYLWGVPNGQDNIAWAVGVEGLCFPYFAKSFQARISIGLSGNGFMESDESDMSTKVINNLEMSFGLGKFF